MNICGKQITTECRLLQISWKYLKNDGYSTKEIRSYIAMAKTTFIKKRVLMTSKLNLELGKNMVKCYFWNCACMDQKDGEEMPKSFEMCFCRRIEK